MLLIKRPCPAVQHLLAAAKVQVVLHTADAAVQKITAVTVQIALVNVIQKKLLAVVVQKELANLNK